MLTLHLKFLNNFSGERFDGIIKEKRSGKCNRDTFAILFLSLSHLSLSPRDSVGNYPRRKGHNQCCHFEILFRTTKEYKTY